VSIYMGAHLGSITGTLRNEIISGAFSFDAASAAGVVDFNTRGVNWPIGKVVNILGSENSLQGPRFLNCPVRLGGYWAQVGATERITAEPTASDCTDTVVLSNTIYGGYFSTTVYCGTTNQSSASQSRYSFIKGSIENKIYSGHFLASLVCGGYVNIYGHVSTDIYGGIFTNIYGDNLANTIYDGVALNIHGVDSYAPVKANNTWKIHVAGSSNITTQTPGRDAVVLTLDGTTPLNLDIPTALHTGKVTGTTRMVLKNAVVDTLLTGFDEIDIALDANDVLTLQLDEPLEVNNVSGTGTIVFDNTNSITVLDSATGNINCVLTNGSVADYTYITAPANTADNAFIFAMDTGVRPSASNGKHWTTGEVVYDHVSISSPNGNFGYDTLAAAVAAYSGADNTYIVLWEDITETVTVNKPIYLDLNGHSASIKLTGEGAVYGMDTTGNDYQTPSGVLTVTGGTPQPAAQVTIVGKQFCYVAIADGQDYTFHRIGLGVSPGLRPNNETNGIGLYYIPYFQADEALAALINGDESYDFGLYVAIDKGADPIGDYHSFRSLISALNVGRTDTSYRAVVYDLMPTNEQYKTKQAQNGDDGSAMTNAEFLEAYDLSKYPIIAQAYLKVGDTYLTGDTSSISTLRDAVVAADRLYSGFAENSPSKLAMDSMWDRYSKVMSTWFSDMEEGIYKGLINFGNIIVDISGWFK